jgi:hypothetical protein
MNTNIAYELDFTGDKKKKIIIKKISLESRVRSTECPRGLIGRRDFNTKLMCYVLSLNVSTPLSRTFSRGETVPCHYCPR